MFSQGNGTYTIQNNISTNNGSVGVHGIYATHVIDNNVTIIMLAVSKYHKEEVIL